MAVLEYVSGTLEAVQRQADRVVPPSTRNKAWEAVREFGGEHPLLFSFLVAQFLFALFPVLFFVSFVLGVLSVALVSAALFSLFWIGLAAVVLGSALFVTAGVAVLVWVWAVGVYLGASFVYGLVVGPSSQVADENNKKLQRKWEQIVGEKDEDAKGVVNGDGEGHDEGEREVAGEEKHNEIYGTDGAHDHDQHTVPSSPSER